MHELSLAIEILKTVLDHGEASDAIKINDIRLEASSPATFSHLNTENLQSYFDLVSKGTIAEGAELAVEFKNHGEQQLDEKESLKEKISDLELLEIESLTLKSLRIEKQ